MNKINTKFAFLDESGDNGARGSTYLVLGLLIAKNPSKIKKVIKNLKKSLQIKKKNKKWLNKRGGEVKFYGFPDDALLRTALKKLAKLNIEITYMAFKKNNKPINLAEKERIMTKLFEEYFNDYFHGIKTYFKIKADSSFFSKPNDKKVYFQGIRYEFTPRFIKTERGKEKIIERMLEFKRITPDEYKIALKQHQNPVILTVEHINSHNCEGIQAIDLITGAIHHYLNTGDETFFQIIKHKIVKGGTFKTLL